MYPPISVAFSPPPSFSLPFPPSLYPSLPPPFPLSLLHSLSPSPFPPSLLRKREGYIVSGSSIIMVSGWKPGPHHINTIRVFVVGD